MKITILIVLTILVGGAIYYMATTKSRGQAQQQPGTTTYPVPSAQQTQETSVDTAQAPAQADSKRAQSSVFNADTPAPELTGITAWLNPPQPTSLKALRGNVVLVDFWTNQCINCIRTLPHVTRWYDTYKDQGFTVIGVHTPELVFERSIDSIEAAINRYNIHYPIAQDNDYKTWRAYDNQYWPALYLVDKQGIIRRIHFGEGQYEQTEQAIQLLLKE
jgi:thiol-disulfide isomerase/thioredoxin